MLPQCVRQKRTPRLGLGAGLDGTAGSRDGDRKKSQSADTLDRLRQDAAKLLEEYETAKLDGTEEEAAKLNEAYERMLAEINAMLG